MPPKKKKDPAPNNENEKPTKGRANRCSKASSGKNGANKSTSAAGSASANENVASGSGRSGGGGGGQSSSGTGRARGAAIKANKRILAEKNDSDSDFEEAPVPSAPKQARTPTSSNNAAAKKAKRTPADQKKNPPQKKTPEMKKQSAQDTKNKKKEKYFCELASEVDSIPDNINNNNNPNHPKNLFDTLNKLKSGRLSSVVFMDKSISPVINNVSQFKVWLFETPFDRRVTSLVWHPVKPGLACIGSKGGDLVLLDAYKHHYDPETASASGPWSGRIEGRGAGGSIQSLKFDEISPARVYMASIDGTVALRDFEGRGDQVFLETNDWSKWFTGLDVNFPGKTIVAGRNNGDVTLLTLGGEELWTKKLHKSKCNFVQFNQREPWLMVTCSVDSVVKIWDIRSIKDKSSSLAELGHDMAVNSAYFSSARGDKLLTTDQHSKIRVYQGPYWDLTRTIVHPHRQFQHLSPIKACWHPLIDIPFAGRYPDPALPGYVENELRSIDFFNPDTGSTLLKLHQPGLDKIISLSQFNPTGDYLLSGMNASVLVWRQKPDKESSEEEEDDAKSSPTRPNNPANFWPEFGDKKAAKKPREKKEKKSKT